MENLFTIGQVIKSCGMSRATILRLEKRGLITPAFIDKETGYRYYDNHNISALLQIKYLTSLDLSYDDILLYYSSNGTSAELLKKIEIKYRTIKRAYDELALRFYNKEHLGFEFVNMPPYICYAKECTGRTSTDKYRAMYNLYHEVIEKGYRPLYTEPLFTITKRTDFLEDEYSDADVSFISCIPLEADSAPADAMVFPRYRAFSCLYHGSYEKLPEVYNIFGKKIRELGLKPIDYVRTYGIVAPYTGRAINADNYLSRLAIPIEKLPD